MPRKARNIQNNKMYHIMVQGINREYIFDDYNKKRHYLNLLRKKLGDYNSIVVAYCIMDNHAHFLLHSESKNEISELFQRLNCAYSNYYNKKNRVGYVFRDRFLSQEIYDNNQLINCIRYIHNNPTKANMVKNAVNYYFSSCKDFKRQSSLVIDFNIINTILEQEENENVFVEDANYGNDKFIDISNYDREKFYKDYVSKLDINRLRQNKKQLKEEVIKCIIDIEVPVKEVAKVFEISDKTIYYWMKK